MDPVDTSKEVHVCAPLTQDSEILRNYGIFSKDLEIVRGTFICVFYIEHNGIPYTILFTKVKDVIVKKSTR